MARPDRAPGPSRTLCPQCAYDLPPPAAMSELHIAEHRVQHLEWEQRGARHPALVAAYRALDRERHRFESRQRARICELEERLEAARWDLKVAGELADDLKADLAAVIEGRHL